MKTPQPRQPGWHKFEGLRTSPTGKFMVQVNDLVKVVKGTKPGTYRALHAGSSRQFSTDVYEGSWERIEA